MPETGAFDRLAAWELRLQRALGTAMSAGQSPKDFLRLFSDELASWIPHHHVDIELLTPDQKEFIYLGAAFRDPPYDSHGDDELSLWAGFSEGERYRLADYTIRHVVATRQALRFDDYRNDPVVLETNNDDELRTMRDGLRYGLVLPLKIGEVVFGVMCYGRGDPHGPFIDEEFELALTLADHVAPFIHTFRAYRLEHDLVDEVKRQRDLLARLNAVSHAVAGALEERDVLATFASELVNTIPCQSLDVRLLTIGTSGARATCRAFGADPDGRWAYAGERLIADEPGHRVLLGEVASEVERADGEGRTVLTVPLHARSRSIGTLSLTGSDELAADGVLATALLFADHLGPFLDSVRLAREAEDRGRELGAVAERHRVAEAIHDSVVQDLIAARQRLPAEHGSIRELLNHALEQSRDLIWSLRRVVVPPPQLRALLEAEITAAGEELGATVDVSLDLGSEGVDAAQATTLYIVAKQLLTNVRRHSRADAISLCLTISERSCQLVVTDNGAGMASGVRPHHPRPDGSGAGLFLVRERVHLAGGELSIRSDYGRGTATEVRLPTRRPDHTASAFLAALAETDPLVVEPAVENPFSVIVVEDHELVREGLRRILDHTPCFVVTGEAEDGVSGIGLIQSAQPAIAVVDLHLPRCAGADVIRAMRSASPSTVIVAVSALDDPHAAYEALEAGAHAFLSKSAPSSDLVRVMRALVEPGRHDYAGSARQIAIRRDGIPERPQLTARELEIVGLMKTDLTYREIGTKLFISEKTVQYHVKNTFTKLGVRTRAAAVSRAAELGLLVKPSIAR